MPAQLYGDPFAKGPSYLTMNSAVRIAVLVSVLVLVLVGVFVAIRSNDRHEPSPVATVPVAKPTPPAVAQDANDSIPVVDAAPAGAAIRLKLTPDPFTLEGPGDGCQLLVTETIDDGAASDVTRSCRFEADPPDAVQISASGYLRALRVGSVTVRAVRNDIAASATMSVGEAAAPVSDFALDIVPILTKAGCNAGQCHGAAQGKGGLQLSLFGYDPESDHATLTRGLEGRRIEPLQPGSSLLLLKPTLAVPHAGGLRIRPGSAEESRLRRWIESGAPWHDPSRGRLERLVVEPSDRFLDAAPTAEQLRVVAEYGDGVRRDVTRHCLFVSNDPSTVTVDKHGLAQLLRPGVGDVLVRYASKVANVRLAAPFHQGTSFDFAALPRRNFIDDHVLELLERMRLPVSPRTSDSEFLRRVYFDLVGHMPDPESPDGSRVLDDFLADTDPHKRDKLIAKLLRHPDFVNFWALKFGDLLQINSLTMGTATGSYRIWLASQLKLDSSGKAPGYDQLVRELLLSKGSLRGGRPVAPATYYAFPQEVGEIAENVARRFLGVRIRCARCHDHPLDIWTQDDYYGFASFFGGVRVEATGEQMGLEVKVVKENLVRHLRTGETPVPTYLGGETADADRDDARELLVDWMLDPSQPRFSRMAVNWVWAHLMGRGLVEPIDDMRDTNPATNPALLDALAQYFRDNNYDLRKLIALICQSETYQRSSTPTPQNEQDEQFFSHALLKPLTAHQMADAIAQVTRVPNSFGQNLGKGTKAIEINDPNVRDYLLDVLGRCDRMAGCEVGALARPASLKLALHLIIGDAINGKLIRQNSIVADWVAAARNASAGDLPRLYAAQIDTLYKRAYCRPPRDEELEFWQQVLAESPDPAEGIEDIVWAVLNSREFVMNH